MAATTIARQGETADMIANRIYGDTAMATALLEANPGLADYGPILPLGTVIILPTRREETRPGYRLWD